MGSPRGTAFRFSAAALLVYGLWSCQSGTATTPGDGGGSPDGAPDAAHVPLPPCGADDQTGCALDSGAEGVCCSGTCVDTQQDSANCDSCGQGCPAGSSCVEGGCVDGGAVATCTAGDDGGCSAPLVCAGGYFCVPASCGAGTPGGACALGSGDQGICCDGGCLPLTDGCRGPNTGNDAGPDAGTFDAGGDAGLDAGTHASPDGGDAGGCGTVDNLGCRIDDAVAGVCCGGSCVDTQSDRSNCDGCGNNCPVGATCVEGTCLDGGVASCTDGGGCGPELVCVGGFFCLSPGCDAGETGGACALPQGTRGACLSGQCAAAQALGDAGPDGG